MSLLATLQATATALQDIITKAGQAQTALTTLKTFLETV
jgi:hypothetical protein